MAAGFSLSRLVPLLCSLGAFILLMLALLAGNDAGVLEDYDIIAVNTTGLGKNLIDRLASRTITTPTRTVETRNICNDLPNVLGKACDSAASAVASAGSAASGAVNDINNDIADRLAEQLHIRDFYSLHALRICEGDFTQDGRRNVTECHPGFAEVGFSIPALLNKTLTLDVGPLLNLNLSLSDLGLTADVELALDSLNSLIKAMTVLFALGVGFTGLTFLASVTSMFIPDDGVSSGLVLWSNLGAVSLALLFLILGGLLASIGARVAQDKINALGRTIGLNAAAGTKWLAIAWVGIGLMVAVAGYWIAAVVRLRKRRKEKVNYDDAEGRKGTQSMSMGEKESWSRVISSRFPGRKGGVPNA